MRSKDRVTGQVVTEVIEATDAVTLQSFVKQNALEGATLYTDKALTYKGISKFKHEAVRHSVSKFVRGKAHTNGIESFWSLLKHGYHGTFHHVSPKHLHRYINEFSIRHSDRSADNDTLAMMKSIVFRMDDKRLTYKNLID